MVPTVLEALGLEAPATIKGVSQSPIEGVSLLSCFADAAAPSQHISQYFEMLGHRSLYHDGWRAVCPWPGPAYAESAHRFGDPISYDQLIQLDAHGWELYNINTDFAETTNLAASERDRLIAMIGMWYVEAGKYKVLPIDSRGTLRFAVERPQIAADRQRYIYYPGTQMVPANAAPRVLNRPHSISVELEVPEGGAEGGFAFYVQNGLLSYGYNYVAEQFFHVRSSGPIPAGHHIVSAEFTPTGAPDIANGKGTPAKVVLFVDGQAVGEGDLPVTIPLSLGLAAGVAVGADPGSPAMPDYKPPFAYSGKIKRALVDVSGTPIEDMEHKMREILARQ
jgi:arylsulfatase